MQSSDILTLFWWFILDAEPYVCKVLLWTFWINYWLLFTGIPVNVDSFICKIGD